ncbi:chemotaxis protein CheX [Ornithinibacillus gellani]|uniref:chemotaxis protein CheX n=1 Tax=Ornithinibacillus gellani TaxID=2293253 RepID=UPI000F48E6BA|nr:chemotaxis protein CheX [Ornithinibacillus gellani]TQS74966.1 chemotaxis protein CheX [Ornithinibacillus gellani]
MTATANTRNKIILDLLNGTKAALQNIVPIPYQMSKPALLGESLHLEYGVLIGIAGDVKGQLILGGKPGVFAAIGKSMFGMDIAGEMLASFSGELGNMLAGSLSTNIVQNGLNTDITSPTIMEGTTRLSGYDRAIQMKTAFEQTGNLDIYLLLD